MKELVNGRETVTLLVKSADDLLRLSSLAGPRELSVADKYLGMPIAHSALKFSLICCTMARRAKGPQLCSDCECESSCLFPPF